MLFLTYFFAETLFAIILSESKKCLLLLYPPINSGGQEKSGKILISWQELKNRFLSFLEADMKRDARLPAKSLLFARKIRISLFGVGVSEWPNNSFSFTRRYFQGNMEAPKEGLPSSGEEVKGNFYNFSP